MNLMIPSYKRAGRVKAIKWFPDALIFVPISQYEEYATHYGANVIAVPDEHDGQLVRKRNFLLDYATEDSVQIEDDFDGFWDNQTKQVVSRERAIHLLWEGYQMAVDLGAGMWGYAASRDPMKYRDFLPFSLTKPISWVIGIIKDDIRFDEKMIKPQVGSDMDFYLQKLNRYRKVFRFNRYTPIVHVGESAGGVGLGMGERKHDYLIRKWGSKIVDEQGIPHSPISGV